MPIAAANALLEIRVSPSRGRGVYSNGLLAPGELIERAPVLILSAPAGGPFPFGELLENYVYLWGDSGTDFALTLGYGSLYNHSYAPNAQFHTLIDENVIEFHALRTISPGEEIFVNYNGRSDDTDPVWFDVTSEPSGRPSPS